MSVSSRLLSNRGSKEVDSLVNLKQWLYVEKRISLHRSISRTSTLFDEIASLTNSVSRVLFSPFFRNPLKSRGIFDLYDRMIILLEQPRLFRSAGFNEHS